MHYVIMFYMKYNVTNEEVLNRVSPNVRTQILEYIPNRYCSRINNELIYFIFFLQSGDQGYALKN